MEEEEFEFLDSKRASPTDFEFIQPEKIRNLDNNEIVVHEDYFLTDFKRSPEDSGSDEYTPVKKRSKRNKKFKAKGLHSMTELRNKIPRKGAKNPPPETKDNITKTQDAKPSYSQVLQGVPEKTIENDEPEIIPQVHCGLESVSCDIEAVDYEIGGNHVTIDALLQLNEETELELAHIVEKIVTSNDVIDIDDVTATDEDSTGELQLSETDENITADENEIFPLDETLTTCGDVVPYSSMCESQFTKSSDEFGLKALFENRLVREDGKNSLIAMKTSTLIVGITFSVIIGILFGNCFASTFMPTSNGGVMNSRKLVKNAMEELERSEERYITVRVDPAPPLFNYSSIWFGQPNEDNLKGIFNEFRHLQRDHIRLQEAYNELKERIHLEKQMKWYWRKQARKDVAPLNSVRYTLHDGLMKVADPTPAEACANDRANGSVRAMFKHEGFEDAIENLTQSLENERQASNYWRLRYNEANDLRRRMTSQDPSTFSLSNRLHMFSKALKRLNISSNVFNLSQPTGNMVDHVRGAWRRLKNQWKSRVKTGGNEATRASVSRFRKMFSMSNVAGAEDKAAFNPPKHEKREEEEEELESGIPTTSNSKGSGIVRLKDNIIIPTGHRVTYEDLIRISEDVEINIIRMKGANSESIYTTLPGIECTSVNASGNPSHNVKGISCRSTGANIKYFSESEEEKPRDKDMEGILVDIVIQSYGPSTNNSNSGNYHNSRNCYSEYLNSEKNNELEWFKQRYEHVVFLSKITKWQNSHNIAKTLEEYKLNIAKASSEKKKEIRRLRIQQEILEGELDSLKQKMLVEKVTLHQEKTKYEKLIENLDKILKTNDRMMAMWKATENEKNRDKLGKLIRRIKKRERSESKEQIEETKGILKAYIEEELKRIDERRKIQSQNEKLKKKLKRKLTAYKQMYKESVAEGTTLRGLYNAARTEVNIQKMIISNLIGKIKVYRNTLREQEKERRDETIHLQSPIDAITSSHITGDETAHLNERLPHNEQEDIRKLSVIQPEEYFNTERCQEEDDEVTEADNLTYSGISIVGSCKEGYCYFTTQVVGKANPNFPVFYMSSIIAEDTPPRPSPSVSMDIPFGPTPPPPPPQSLHPLPQNMTYEEEYIVFDSSPGFASHTDDADSYASLFQSRLSKRDEENMGRSGLIYIPDDDMGEFEESKYDDVTGPNLPQDLLEPNPSTVIGEEEEDDDEEEEGEEEVGEDLDTHDVFPPTPSRKHLAEAISKTSQSTNKKRY